MSSDISEKERAGSLKYFFVGLVCWNLAVSIDSTALSVALPTISHELNATSTQAFWCGTAFTLCSAAFQPIYASFSDAFGRKPMLLTALTLFTIGSVICGISHHIAVLLVGRSVQGAGGGGLLTMTYVLMTDSLSLQERHKAITALSLTWLVGTVVGPIMSGGFTDRVSWRWIFWLNIPFCVFSYIVIIFFIKTTYKPSQSRLAGLKQIDWLGSTLFVGSITSFLIPLSWGGTMYAWHNWHTYAPLGIGSLGLIVWLLYSLYLTSRPMIPLSIMANRTASLNYIGNLIHGIVQFGGLYYLPLYYQTVLGYSPTISGVAMLPQCIVAAPFSAIAAIVIAKTNSVKPLLLASWICLTIGIALFSLLEPDSSIPRWILLNIPSGIGVGALFGGLALATQAAAEVPSGTKSAQEIYKVRGMAASLNPFFRTLGQALGIVIAQAAFTNEMRKRAGEELASDAASLGQVIAHYSAGSPQRVTLIEEYNESLHTVWFVLCGLAGGMLLLTLFVKDIGPKGENRGFLGFGGLKSAGDDEKKKTIKVVKPTPSMSVLLSSSETEHKQAAWGLRERDGSDSDTDLEMLDTPTMHSPASSKSGSNGSKSYTPSEHIEHDAHDDKTNRVSRNPHDSYASFYSIRPSQQSEQQRHSRGPSINIDLSHPLHQHPAQYPPAQTNTHTSTASSLYSPRLAHSQTNLLSSLSPVGENFPSPDPSQTSTFPAPETPPLQSGTLPGQPRVADWNMPSPSSILVEQQDGESRRGSEFAPPVQATDMMAQGEGGLSERGQALMDSVTSSVLEEMMMEDDERFRREEKDSFERRRAEGRPLDLSEGWGV